MLVATLGSACNSVTGAGGYADTSACTGTACSLVCTVHGGAWDAAAKSCVCPGGAAPCNGLCCGASAPYCVTTTAGVDRCSTCTEAAFECGAVCCERQICLNPSIGACGAPYGVSGQSCAGGLTCPVPRPDQGTESADCCESIPLPGGAFEMGRSQRGNNQCPAWAADAGLAGCNESEQPAHQVTLTPYRLDRFEVTVSRFRKFVDAWDYAGLPDGAGGTPVVPGSGWREEWNALLPASRARLEKDLACLTDHFDVVAASTWTSVPAYYENLPVNCVTWYEAFAFCVWDGGRLPTEAEWEYAAGNGAAGDLYPWGGAEPTSRMSVYNCVLDPTPCAVQPPIPAYVGSHPIDSNRWGHRDLAGNVAEWVLDSVGPYAAAPVKNYANTADGFRDVRGSDFGGPPIDLRATARGALPPREPASGTGVRCARGP